MIIPVDGDYVSIDINRMYSDEVFNKKPFHESYVPIKILAWWVNEDTGRALPVLLNGVKAKDTDVILNVTTGAWHCGHDRGFDRKEMFDYINEYIASRKANASTDDN